MKARLKSPVPSNTTTTIQNRIQLSYSITLEFEVTNGN